MNIMLPFLLYMYHLWNVVLPYKQEKSSLNSSSTLAVTGHTETGNPASKPVVFLMADMVARCCWQDQLVIIIIKVCMADFCNVR